jgi:hypothetical protein
MAIAFQGGSFYRKYRFYLDRVGVDGIPENDEERYSTQ